MHVNVGHCIGNLVDLPDVYNHEATHIFPITEFHCRVTPWFL